MLWCHLKWLEKAILEPIPTLDFSPLSGKAVGKLKLSPEQLLIAIQAQALAEWALKVTRPFLRPHLKRGAGGRPIRYQDSSILLMAVVQTAWRKSYDQMVDYVRTPSRISASTGLYRSYHFARPVLGTPCGFRSLDLSQDRQCLIDSLPIPVVQFHLVPSSTGDWKAYQAAFGKAITKKQTIFGYRLHLLITMSGLILDFELSAANATDLEVGVELLEEHTDLEVSIYTRKCSTDLHPHCASNLRPRCATFATG